MLSVFNEICAVLTAVSILTLAVLELRRLPWWKLRGRRMRVQPITDADRHALALSKVAFGDPVQPRPMSKFEREIIEARMTADDELEYERIMRQLYGMFGTPPTFDVMAAYDELVRRLDDGEISSAQFEAETFQLGRAYWPVFR